MMNQVMKVNGFGSIRKNESLQKDSTMHISEFFGIWIRKIQDYTLLWNHTVVIWELGRKLTILLAIIKLNSAMIQKAIWNGQNIIIKKESKYRFTDAIMLSGYMISMET